MRESVEHYVSVDPDHQTVSRARLVSGGATDDVALFIGDHFVGTLHLPRGKGERVCEQMGLVHRDQVCSYLDVVREFERALGSKQQQR